MVIYHTRNNVASYNKANSLQGHVNNVGGFLLEGLKHTPNTLGNTNNKPITNAGCRKW